MVFIEKVTRLKTHFPFKYYYLTAGSFKLEMGIPGKIRKRGRPTRSWMDNIREDMRDVGLKERIQETEGNEDRHSSMVTLLGVGAAERRRGSYSWQLQRFGKDMSR